MVIRTDNHYIDVAKAVVELKKSFWPDYEVIANYEEALRAYEFKQTSFGKLHFATHNLRQVVVQDVRIAFKRIVITFHNIKNRKKN